MTWFSRVLFLLTFMLFWGGLTFYTGFVVRVSHEVLDDPMDGGLVTQQTTRLLQVTGAVAAVMMIGNGLAVGRHDKKLGWVLSGLGALVACSILGQFIVHGHLDAVIDVSAREITDRDAFDTGHRRYNQLTTMVWLGSLLHLAITVRAWSVMDRGTGPE